MTHLRSDEWCVRNIPDHGEAVQLVRAWHYSSSAPNTSTYRHGLFTADFWSFCHGVALWIPPTMTAARAIAGDGASGVLSLSRLVVDPDCPTNAASFLLGRSPETAKEGP